ncbi:unnamed protein product [Angiostrongylus costaricensis]|uniref:NDK domain-containing protein n=1 Tax=Angiostrongylus costaricensis TaxID=334426 RepID=A0A158PJU2_ANGCS|nr:unnamed protein product [Angiostrongylus costaricensis]
MHEMFMNKRTLTPVTPIVACFEEQFSGVADGVEWVPLPCSGSLVVSYVILLACMISCSTEDSDAGDFESESETRVRFCKASQNTVRIIPPVNTTLPFAVRMAQEKEVIGKEMECGGSPKRTDGEDDIGEENVVPKCGKIIIGKCFIAVDRFVRKDSCKYHFLTHAHVDHYANLNKTWKSPIYCSEVTARILPTLMGKKAIPKRLLHPLKVGETHEIEPNFHVGASIPGGSVLCTGDFRADNRLICRFESDSSFKKLAGTYISKIYFDNTHLDHTDASFPSRTECEERLMREMDKHRRCNILIPVFRLGREEILEKLSKDYSEVISTSNERLMVRRLCGLNEGEFREDNDSARIRTSQRQPRYVLQALANMKDPKVVVDLSLRGEYNELRFGELVPISAPMDSKTAEELMKLSKEILGTSFIEIVVVVNLLVLLRSNHHPFFKPSDYHPDKIPVHTIGFHRNERLFVRSPVLTSLRNACCWRTCENMSATNEWTFIAVQPDGVHRNLVGKIIQRFEGRGYKFFRCFV